MQRFEITILISTFLHLFLLALIAFFISPYEPVEEKYVQIVFDLVVESLPADEPRPEATEIISPPLPEPPVPRLQQKTALPELPPELPVDALIAHVQTANDSLYPQNLFDILTGNTANQKEKTLNRSSFFNEYQAGLQHKIDSMITVKETVARNFAKFSLSKDALKKQGKRNDYVGQSQHSKSMGSNPGMINLFGLFAGAARKWSKHLGTNRQYIKRELIMNPPSRTEIVMLKKLWKKGSGLDVDLYSGLDTTIQITNTDLNRVLAAMTQKGWLRRNKVSPENILTFLTPFGPAGGVEMSPKNRKNPVYIYYPRISKEQVLTALDLALYYRSEISLSSEDSTTYPLSRECNSLKKRIFQLLED